MSTNAPVTYTQMDSVTYLNMINNRIRDLEVQYAQLQLRVAAPAPTDVITEQDHTNLSALDTSLTYLRNLAQQVQDQIHTAPTTAPAR